MTDLTTLLSPTATTASSPAPAAPASVTGVPGMAAQFAQTLGDMLAGTPAVAAPAPTPVAPTPVSVAPPDAAQPLPILGLVGPLPDGKLLATGIIDRQALADDGNAVPADPAIQFLANPAWRASVVVPAPPRTPVPLRAALERAAAQLATPALAKAARGTSATADAPADDADPVSVLSDTPSNDPAAPTPDLPASAPAAQPALVPISPFEPNHPTDADAAEGSPGPVVTTSVEPAPGNPVAVAGPVATPAAPTRTNLPAVATAEPDSVVPTLARPIRALATVGATPPVLQAETTAIAGPAPAPARTGRALPSDRAILAALGALPIAGRDAGIVQNAAPAALTTPVQSAPPIPTATPPAPFDGSQSRATDVPPPSRPEVPTGVPAATAALPLATATTSAALAGRTAATAPDATGRGETMPVRADRSVVPPVAVSTTPQPAGQVFAAALATAANWRDRPRPDPLASERPDPAAPTPPLGFATAVAPGSTTPVQPTGDAQRAPLDLTQDSGVQRMIDHIEVLRDDADSRDTRIRLVPDALGSVDVAVRQVGERIHVSFTAEHEATRALIADAQPRLTELAAERGVRIVGTSVATDANPGASQSPAQGQAQTQGQAQSQSQTQSQSRPNAPQQPPRASARAQRDTETPEDQRLA
ncbi:flagellar hook-length control protein FliK [Sphingomonas sp. PAMC 26617]|uniref:flagellar hook-length control protein FliK n=1 Tax=Sphingomonas sp. PAMC 26617 TaxID=1112216 RepID=UPI0002FB6F05|nr:flagellar hook-length control protein FliK [Sphingomonas sp. PAMC 26617]